MREPNWEDRVPAQGLLGERADVHECVDVGEQREAVRTDDRVELSLCFLANGRIERESEKCRLDGSVCLVSGCEFKATTQKDSINHRVYSG